MQDDLGLYYTAADADCLAIFNQALTYYLASDARTMTCLDELLSKDPEMPMAIMFRAYLLKLAADPRLKASIDQCVDDLSKTKKLRYMGNFFKKKLYIIFLPGFMSNIEGEKPKSFKKYAVKKKLGFLTLDYSGHGKSSGEFTKGNISRWSNDTKILIKRFVKKNNFIVILSLIHI